MGMSRLSGPSSQLMASRPLGDPAVHGAASTAPAAPGAGTYVKDCPLQPGLCSLQAALGGWTHPEPSLMPGGSWQQEGDVVNTCRWLLFVHLVTQIVPLGICW